jgi:hypothetical protein
MAPYKKLVKVEAQAQVEEHLSSSNGGGSTQVRIVNVPRNSSCSFCARYQPFTRWAIECTNDT